MRTVLCFVAVALITSISRGAEPAWRIVVNVGGYPSAQEAANSQSEVNWFDADTSDDTICTEAFAATELRKYLCKITGRDEKDPDAFPIVDDDADAAGTAFLIGSASSNRQIAARAAALDLKQTDRKVPQRFQIRSNPTEQGGMIALSGDDRIGTLYAVYAFLEKLGVRWFAPGEIHEQVPRLAKLTIPALHLDEKPAFLTRGFWAWEDRGGEDFILWMARNRMNQWTAAYHDPATLKKLGIIMTCGGHQPMPKFMNPTHEYPYKQTGLRGNDGKPDDPYPRGDGKGDIDGDGKLTYAEAHPEWFGLQDGKRSFKIRNEFGDNFCTSNPYAVEEFTKGIIAELSSGEWKWADRLHLFMLDGGRWCTCDACAALGNANDRNVLLAHQVRKAIAAAHAAGELNRDVSVVFSCYTGYLDPPTRPLPEDFDYEHCLAGFYPIRRCFVHTLASPQCEEFNAVVNRKLLGWFSGPQHQYKGAFYVGEYYNISRNKNLPSGFSHSMAIDIPYYYQMGARHMDYMHVPHTNWGTRALNNYQMAGMLWNPALNVAELRDDYFRNRYGNAADVMRQFYDHLEVALSNSKILKSRISGGLASGSTNLFPSRHQSYDPRPAQKDTGPSLLESVAEMQTCRALIDQAMSMDLDGRVRARMTEDAELFAYGENTIHFYNHMVLTDRYLRDGREDLARREFEQVSNYAQKLKADTKSTDSASAHANASDGLAATYDEAAFEKLRKRFASPASTATTKEQ